ncbi:MAG: ankyrin repeat domain-containing protein [Desulfobacteraceae bacterium]|nr:ankyrin repeat domain-containing protein [Desulfobacteraceae bacterium]
MQPFSSANCTKISYNTDSYHNLQNGWNGRKSNVNNAETMKLTMSNGSHIPRAKGYKSNTNLYSSSMYSMYSSSSLDNKNAKGLGNNSDDEQTSCCSGLLSKLKFGKKNQKTYATVFEAIEKDDVDYIYNFNNNNGNINIAFKNDEGKTALDIAAKKGSVKMIKALIDNVNTSFYTWDEKAEYVMSAIVIAKESNNHKTAEYLRSEYNIYY